MRFLEKKKLHVRRRTHLVAYRACDLPVCCVKRELSIKPLGFGATTVTGAETTMGATGAVAEDNDEVAAAAAEGF